ncbi:MAG: peroxide stress protein YaaA [Arenicella sp.]
MLIVISPAKSLDFETPASTDIFSTSDYLEHSAELIETLKPLSPDQIGSLMKISSNLAELNVNRYHDWQPPFDLENAKQSVQAFKGDVYAGLDAASLHDDDLQWAQQHLRILSGLYGLLRPLDLIQAYRLEMGIKLDNPRGKNLYEFWGEKITEGLNQQLASIGSETLINLASKEYFKSIKPKSLNAEIVTPDFKDWKNGQYKIISFYAKKARGMMSRWIIENRIERVDQLQDFSVAGYRFDADMSSGNDLIFIRDEQP